MVVAGLLFCTALIAQGKHEVSVYGGGGLSTLKYETTTGEQKNGLGSLLGVGYTYFFKEKIGFVTGAELAIYNAKINLDDLSINYMTRDYDGDSFEFRSKVNDYEEKQNTMFVNIPLMLQYQIGEENNLYIAAGGKIGFFLGGTYKTDKSIIKNSGYYEDEDYEYTEQEFLGFGTFKDRNANDDIKFKMTFMLSAETGMKWKLKDDLYLYTGIYIDYGLNNIQKKDNEKPFVEYNPTSPKDFIINSALASHYNKDNKSEVVADKVNLMAIGVKIKLAFELGRNNR